MGVYNIHLRTSTHIDRHHHVTLHRLGNVYLAVVVVVCIIGPKKKKKKPRREKKGKETPKGPEGEKNNLLEGGWV